MKKAFFTLMIIAFCASCSENSVNPANGLWEYNSQDTGKPQIDLDFDLDTSGSGTLKSINFEVDGETDTEFETFSVLLENHAPGQNIGRLVLTKLENNLPNVYSPRWLARLSGIFFYKSTIDPG